jgi:hypothetical protein
MPIAIALSATVQLSVRLNQTGHALPKYTLIIALKFYFVKYKKSIDVK